MRMQTLGNSAKKALSREGGIIIRYLTRLIRSDGKDISCVSYTAETFHTQEQPRGLNLQSYLVEKARLTEVEREKAMVIIESRHERWTFGGPN
jgi:hypothetical protein